MKPIHQMLGAAVQAQDPGTKIEWTLRGTQYVLAVTTAEGAGFIHTLPGWLEDCNLPPTSEYEAAQVEAIIIAPLLARLRNRPLRAMGGEAGTAVLPTSVNISSTSRRRERPKTKNLE